MEAAYERLNTPFLDLDSYPCSQCATRLLEGAA
jgi:hypothetical protein